MYAADRQLFFFALVVLALIVGCGDDEYSSIPVSPKEEVPFTYEGSLGRIWGGDNFEVIREQRLHYAFIRGIDTPEPGQAFHEEATELLSSICNNRLVVVSVVQRDEWKREVSDVLVRDPSDGREFDIALELVQKGLAWHDLSEEPWADRYREAELFARSQKIGIWSQANPIPPWEYWQRQLQQATGGSEQ